MRVVRVGVGRRVERMQRERLGRTSRDVAAEVPLDQRAPRRTRPARLLSLVAASVLLVVSVGVVGAVLPVAAAPIGTLHWSAPIQPIVPVNHTRQGLAAVSCRSTLLCVAVGSLGAVVTSKNPTGGANAWHQTQVTPDPKLYGVSCPSLTLCVAVGGGGDVATSTNPTGGATAWTVTNVENNQRTIASVSCPSVHFCVAVGNGGAVLTSTNPGGGKSAWKLTTITGGPSLTAVSCVSTSLCVVVGHSWLYASGNPLSGVWAGFSPTKFFFAGTGASCASLTSCIVTSSQGDVLASTKPTGGPTAWFRQHVAVQTNGLFAASCPSTAMCLVTNTYHDVAESLDPTGIPSVWSTTNIAPQDSGYLFGLSCGSVSLCVVADGNGNVVIGTNPG
jgi:hypothetical protein